MYSPVISTKEVQWPIQLYNVRPKQHIVAHCEMKPIYTVNDSPGTEKGARNHPTSDDNVLGCVEDIQ